jgi:hypothetical protein
MSISTDEGFGDKVEICRVTYNEGGWMKLMRQTCKDNAPFYWVSESHKNYDSSVDSSSEDLQYIIDYMERRIAGNKRIMDSLPQDEIEVRKVYIHHTDVTRQFVNKLRGVAAGKAAEISEPSHNTGMAGAEPPQMPAVLLVEGHRLALRHA